MSEGPIITHSKKWDQTGVLISSLCIVHCLSLPFLVVLLPSFSSYFESHWFHFFMHFSVIGVALLSLFTSYRKHKNHLPLILGSLGVGVLLTSYVLGEAFGYFDHLWPDAFGSLIVLSAHVWNMRICHCFCHTPCRHSGKKETEAVIAHQPPIQ